jgi:hypothetical protein
MAEVLPPGPAPVDALLAGRVLLPLLLLLLLISVVSSRCCHGLLQMMLPDATPLI